MSGSRTERATGSGGGLSAVSTPDVLLLRDAVLHGRVRVPVDRAAFGMLGIRQCEAALGLFRDLGQQATLAILDVALAERRARPATKLDLVWTGPDTVQSTARDTEYVVRSLFAQVERSIIVGGFSFDNGKDIFAPLHQRMREAEIDAEFFLDIKAAVEREDQVEAYATDFIDKFLHNNWPQLQDGQPGPNPRPTVFYDPRTVLRGEPWASLHAKCIVVDEERTFITSANFTARGQTRNIEVGVLIEDPAFARKLAAQWRGLVTHELVAGYAG